MMPFNWNYFRLIQIFGASPQEPPVKELVTHISPRPILFVAAGADDLEPALAMRYATYAGPNASFWVVPNAAHAAGLQTRWDEYTQRMLLFFEQSLLRNLSSP